jgi:NDP-sugar pyrophosphorylase family protein
MKAMILAAGLGTRLLELTKDRPKPLVELAGVPMITYVVKALLKVGVTDLVINLHYYPDQIVNYFKKNNNFNININFSIEDELLDTGGGVAKVANFFDDDSDIIIHNADVFSTLDLKLVLDFHKNNSNLATLVANQKNTGRVLLFDDQNQLVGWRNTDNNTEKLILSDKPCIIAGFTGIQVVNKKLFHYFPRNEKKFSIITTYLEAVSDNQKIIGYDLGQAKWFDLGTKENLVNAEQMVLSNPALKIS